MSSVVPEGWSRQKLGDSLISRPKSKLPSGQSNPLGYYDFYVCSHKVLKSFHNEYSSPSILFSTGGEASVHLATECYAFSTDVWATEFEGDICNEYVFRLLEENIRIINYKGFQGSGIKHLDKSFIEKLEFSIPPLFEQKKIASILTSVDEVIENTQKQIDKLQDLKKATMNELLIKGIGHTDFKDSELGLIPKSWKLVSLGNAVKSPICYGIVQVGDYDAKGVEVIAIKYLGKIKQSPLHRSQKTIEQKYKRSRVQCGDVLISIKGTIGKLDVVPEGFKGNISRDIAKISLLPNYIPDVLVAYLESDIGKLNIDQTTVGTTRAELSISRLKKLRIPFLPIEEQKKVQMIYRSLNKDIETKKKKLHQYQSLKKSLMQDLLTGKVRVTVN